jgi:hypothetical protein
MYGKDVCGLCEVSVHNVPVTQKHNVPMVRKGRAVGSVHSGRIAATAAADAEDEKMRV